MRTFCTLCGSRFTETKRGDDVCPHCREAWEEEDREEQRREEEGVDFGGAMVEGFKEMFQSWAK